MLNRAERFKMLKLIRNCSIIGCFPTVVDLSGWQLLQASRRRRWLSIAYFGTFVLNFLYKFGTLFGVLFTQKSTPLHQLILHAISAIGGLFIIFWYYEMYINHAGILSTFLRMTLTGNIGGMVVQCKEPTKSISRLRTYTLQDLVAINLPYMIAAVVVTVVGTTIYDPTLQLLLYAGLPEQLQSRLSFTVLLLEELRYLLMLCAVSIPIWTLQLISFDLVYSQLKLLVESIKRTANRQKLKRSYHSLRHIQLYVTIINVVNRYIIFSWKCLCIGACIGTGYAAIAHFSDYPIFGVLYYINLCNSMVIFIVSYDKAFAIPELFKEVTRFALLRFHRGRHGVRCPLFKRQMRSIPRFGIKIGDFHVFERESTPNFVHYVLSNIVTMLVAYKR